jgi:hypothetical protein
VLAAAADKRSEATYYDADAVLHEAVKIQEQPRGTCSPRHDPRRPEPVGPAPPGGQCRLPASGSRTARSARPST